MKILKLLDKQRQVVAIIQPTLSVHSKNKLLKKEVEVLVKKAKKDGIPVRRGASTEKDGRQIFVEQHDIIQQKDEKFLVSLCDLINHTRFTGERLFAVIKDE